MSHPSKTNVWTFNTVTNIVEQVIFDEDKDMSEAVDSYIEGEWAFKKEIAGSETISLTPGDTPQSN